MTVSPAHGHFALGCAGRLRTGLAGPARIGRIPIARVLDCRDLDIGFRRQTRRSGHGLSQRLLEVWVKVDIKPFTPPGAWLAYQQLLLGAKVPLVPIAERRETILSQMHKVSEGNPDKFTKDALNSTIDAFRAMDVLVPATDIERLAQLTGQAL